MGDKYCVSSKGQWAPVAVIPSHVRRQTLGESRRAQQVQVKRDMLLRPLYVLGKSALVTNEAQGHTRRSACGSVLVLPQTNSNQTQIVPNDNNSSRD